MFSWLCRPCRLKASGSGEVGPLEDSEGNKLERTLLFVSGNVMERALLGELVKTITERKFPIVNMKMTMCTDKTKLQTFYKHHNIIKDSNEVNTDLPFVVAIIQKTSALKALPVIMNQFRADHALDYDDVFCSDNAKGANRDVATWFSVEELQTKPPLDLPGTKKSEDHTEVDAPADPTAHGQAPGEVNGDSLSETNPFHESNGEVHDSESTHELVQSNENK